MKSHQLRDIHCHVKNFCTLPDLLNNRKISRRIVPQPFGHRNAFAIMLTLTINLKRNLTQLKKNILEQPDLSLKLFGAKT